MAHVSVHCGPVPVGALRGPAGVAQGGVVELEYQDGTPDGMGKQGVTDAGTLDLAGLRAIPRQGGCTIWCCALSSLDGHSGHEDGRAGGGPLAGH